ncbi:hypothetical protein JB92DRAFT_3120212 [Gautieria morchelliformis]|nr:hypothetical protein JB92DRAFT_3120212 [Gautieria morchelliformis]
MAALPSVTEWVETAQTTVQVHPSLHENLQEDLEGWIGKATGLQEAFRGIMRVEMALDATYTAPSVVGELSEDVKLVHAWLDSPDQLTRGSLVVGNKPAPLLALASFQAVFSNDGQFGKEAEVNTASEVHSTSEARKSLTPCRLSPKLQSLVKGMK